MVTIEFKLADIKLESYEAHLVKLEKICRRIPKSLTFFSKKSGFKHMPISQTLLYLQENEQHFLKVPLLFIKDANSHRNRLNRLPKNAN